jgi:hypothetical protein
VPTSAKVTAHARRLLNNDIHDEPRQQQSLLKFVDRIGENHKIVIDIAEIAMLLLSNPELDENQNRTD